ncbi:hypothetical protein [Aromatoleum aromaticum]|nr:hypothetical protein [Aromatoleum aromaticum]
MATRLDQALTLLGYQDAKQLHYRSNLVHAIHLFAGVQGDAKLEAECEAEIARIRAAVEQARST